MRPIGTLATHDDAVRLGDYLLAIGLRNHVEPTRDGSAYLVWIEHDDDIEQGQLQLRQFQSNPNDPRYDEAGAAARAKRKLEYESVQRRQRNYNDVRTGWSGMKLRPTPVASALIGLCIVVGAMTLLGLHDNPFSSRVVDALSFQPVNAAVASIEAADGRRVPATMFSAIAHGQFWRLITPAFLHFSPLHLVFNVFWIVSLGRLIEVRKGSVFLLLFVLAAAAVSNCGEALWSVYHGPADTFGFSHFGGFSGVVYGLFGYVWMKGRLQPYELMGMNQQAVGMMLGWLVLCMTGMLGPIANGAHVVGLIVGVCVGAWPSLMRKAKART